MSKKIIVLAMVGLMLTIGMPALWVTQVQAQNPPQTSEERMQQEISELRELIQLLLLLNSQQSTENSAIADVPQISMQRAIDIALEHVTGQGTIGTIMLFRENGVLTYEVNVTTSAANYTIYINAMTGVITGNNREVLAIWQPPVPVPTPQPTWTPAPGTHTPSSSGSSSSSPGSSSSSSSPSGRW
ncbi:MAG: PepSY domain-containing protein [Defluviitaleaceae bacterium]|nr:PepSY domain-containing protein [Defluviitaleaceae bacterium]